MERFGSEKIKYFFGIESLIYITFLILDMTRQSSALSGILKFVGISLCACFVWLGKGAVNQWKHQLFQYLYVFLLISDMFLLFTDYYTAGIITFIIVQMFYFYYLLEGKKVKLIQYGAWHFIVFLCLLFLFAVFHILIDSVLLAACFYFVQFTGNVILSIKKCRKEQIYFLIGIILFYLCDINVGLYQASLYFTNDWIHKLYGLSGTLMWFFYLPGQVLLAYSSISEK